MSIVFFSLYFEREKGVFSPVAIFYIQLEMVSGRELYNSGTWSVATYFLFLR